MSDAMTPERLAYLRLKYRDRPEVIGLIDEIDRLYVVLEAEFEASGRTTAVLVEMAEALAGPQS